ncbi:MAG: GNAT family N-acetyltransferase [bacterium]|nr:GNAT family N-acetyltransferase [Candidatus Kapabacteria bacterium]
MSIEGLSIRRAEPDDAEALREIYSGASTYGGTLQLPFPSIALWRKNLSEPTPGVYLLVAVVDTRVVGSISLHTFPERPRRRHAGGIGMGVHQDWQSRGVGTAMMEAIVNLADSWVNLTRLELEVFTDNERAIKLYERFGFEREGTLRSCAYRDGAFVDVYYMARLRT